MPNPVAIAKDGSTLLRIHVQPRASKNRVSGMHGDALKIAITSPPVDGKANDTIIQYLAKYFGVGRKELSIVSGKKSRIKTVKFNSMKEKELVEHLQHIL